MLPLCVYRKDAGIELGGGSFLIHRHYKDDIMTHLLNSAAKICGKHAIHSPITVADVCSLPKWVAGLGGAISPTECLRCLFHHHILAVNQQFVELCTL